MNDPHVVALIYGIEHRASVDYEEAESFVCEEPAFRLEVKDKKTRFELKDHYAEESAARESIEEYIRVWEFDVCLNNGSFFGDSMSEIDGYCASRFRSTSRPAFFISLASFVCQAPCPSTSINSTPW